MTPLRRVAVLAVCSVAVGLGAGCGAVQESNSGQEKTEELPTMSIQLGGDAVTAFPSATELIRNSYVIARGRFVGGPTTVQSAPVGEEFPSSLVVWEFVPDKVYRDVRVDGAPAKVAESQRGSILIAANANEVGATRGDQPIDEFVRSVPDVFNLNSYPVDRPLYVFLRPGVMPQAVIERDAELAHVMAVAEKTQCYLVNNLDRSCANVADAPGGEPQALLEEGALVPLGLSSEAIAGAGSVAEVVSATAPEDVDLTIDAARFEVFPGGGGEG